MYTMYTVGALRSLQQMSEDIVKPSDLVIDLGETLV
jgi:hypothetical protein